MVRRSHATHWKDARHRGSRGSRGGASLTNMLLAFALALLVAIAAGGIVWGYQIYSSREGTDPETLCPEKGLGAVTVMLLDLTDPLGTTQTARLHTLIEREVEAAGTNTLISIGVVSEDASNWGSRFTACKPATGAEANALYENASLMAERFETGFRQPLEAAIDAMMTTEEQDRSPIMESLQALLAETPQASEDGIPLRLVLVSDLLQNSDLISFYRGEGWEYFEESGASERLSHALGDAKIHLVVIPRSEAPALARDLIDPFWSRYFDRQGASAPIELTPLGDL